MPVTPINYEAMGRSTLKSEPPIAFGTALVESVDGYLERLAAAHDTMRRTLERVVWGGGPPIANSEQFQDSFLADAPSAASQAFCKSLADLTRQPCVTRMGLGWMCKVMPMTDALKPNKAWCVACCRDSYQGRRNTYWPLLWSIAGVNACPVHQILLRERCHWCGNAISGKRGPRYPFHSCPRCQQLLHASPAANAAALTTRATLEQLAVAEKVGDMLADWGKASPDVALELPNFRKVVDSAVRRGLVRGTNEFLRRAKMSRSTYSSLINGGRVSLRIAIRMAMAADIALAGLFGADLWKERLRDGLPLVPAPKPRQRINSKELRDAVEKEISSGTACSVHQFCRNSHVDRKDAKRVLGSLTDELAMAAVEARARKTEASAAAMAEAISQELKRMRASGIRPSARALAKAVSSSRHRLDFVAGLQIARPEVEIRYCRFRTQRVA